MNKHLISMTLGMTLAVAAGAQAQNTTLSPKAQLAADTKAATARYESDKALCADETSTKARLQCRRDAKAEYDAAIAAAKARTAAATAPLNGGTVSAKAAAPVCADCGTVAAVAVKEEPGKGGPVGMIAGGVGGALLGRQIGGGTGKDIATIAGAAGGAYAGKKIEEKMTSHQVWTVTVDYPNNIKRSFQFDKDPGFKVGDPVRNSGNSVVRQ
ncbi:MAG TPA: glycine zipper 2TM domain-containing protein [Ramlibacter sp.]